MEILLVQKTFMSGGNFVDWKGVSFSLFSAWIWALSAVVPLRAQVPQTPLPGIPQASSPVGNTAALASEAQGWLVDLVKINTTNPPGNEQVAAKYIAGILAKEGINAEGLDLAPGRSAVVARLRSSAIADPSKALLLVAHMDTVGVDRSKWSVDPFGGVIRDGYLYGRGSVDDKGMLAANLAITAAASGWSELLTAGRPTARALFAFVLSFQFLRLLISGSSF